MLSAAATPVAGRASHFAAQSQSHRQGREETSAERTVGLPGRSRRNAPRPDGRSDVVVCFYVFGLYHSFMMKKTIYRTCLFGRTGPRERVNADSPLAPILPRHGDGRGFGGERGSGAAPTETGHESAPCHYSCFVALISLYLTSVRWADAGGPAAGRGVRVRSRRAIDLSGGGSGARGDAAAGAPFSYHKVSQRFLHLTIV